MARLQVVLNGIPISPRRARKPRLRIQPVMNCRRSEPIVGLTHTWLVPEESLSRYMCTSKTMLLPGSTTLPITFAFGVPYQVAFQLKAPDHALPGTVTTFKAPVLRMAASAAFAAASHCSVGMVFGSFIMPKTTLSLSLNWLASRAQKSASAVFGTAAEPTRLPR